MTTQQTTDAWEEYEAEGDYIPPEKWGRDHWSTLLYLETRAVDHGGIINNANMRCNSRLHREFSNVPRYGAFGEGKDYPTRLREGEQPNHDDWSCLEDLVAAGFIKSQFRVVKPDEVFGNSTAWVKFLEPGLEVVHRLRQHKMGGGGTANFIY